MKTWIRTFAFALLAAAAPVAAVVMPMRIPFQGKLIDPATNNPKNGSFSMVFKIWDAPTGGNTLFTETQSVTVVNGQFTAQIGTVTYLNADFLAGTSAYLGVTVGADAEMTPRQPLSMSPYAYTALQLASDKTIRINSGTAYSTFTTLGNWQFPYGISAGSAAIVDNVFTVGTSSFSVGGGSATVAYRLSARNVVATDSVTANAFFGDASHLTGAVEGNTFFSSKTFTDEVFIKSPGQIKASSATFTFGIVAATATYTSSMSVVGGGGLLVTYGINAGTAVFSGNSLSVGGSSFTVAGGSATIGYGLTVGSVNGTIANFMTVTSTNVGTFSVTASSGIDMNAGTLSLVGSRGIDAQGTGIVATTATFSNITSTGVGTYGIVTSSGIDMNGGTLTLDPSSRGIDAQGTGIVATTATFMTVVSTNVGSFGITTSSGINMGGGSLLLDPDSRGISAIGTGIVASTANFVSVSTWSVQSSSGILISLGPLTLAAASNGIDARSSSVTARQFFGSGAPLTNTRMTISTFSAMGTLAAATATEVLLASAPITPALTSSRVLVQGTAVLRPGTATAGTWTLRVRSANGGVCTTGSGQVGLDQGITHPATANFQARATYLEAHAPAVTTAQWYCLTAIQSSGSTMFISSRTLVLTESQ